MELVNFVGAYPSKDGKYLLVTLARKGSDEKFRLIVPYGAQTAYESEKKYYVLFPKAKNEPKEEPKEDKSKFNANEEDIPF